MSSPYDIPGPVSRYGVFSNETPFRPVPYDGSWIPHFIGINGGDRNKSREFLRLNRIGSIINRSEDSDLFYGRSLLVPQATPSVSRHREYLDSEQL